MDGEIMIEHGKGNCVYQHWDEGWIKKKNVILEQALKIELALKYICNKIVELIALQRP